jgi:DNA-binding transcriptional ArsR family regulator
MTAGDDSSMHSDRDLAPVAALLGDPARAAMLSALAGGQALPAGELARRAGVHPATATAHVRRLVDGGLVRVYTQGRHRYHELAGPKVAVALEALAQLAPPAPVRSLRAHRVGTALAEARTCYDHLAGRRGVQLRDRLLASEALVPVNEHNERDHRLTAGGARLMNELDVDVDRLTHTRRVFARSCVEADAPPSAPGRRAAGSDHRPSAGAGLAAPGNRPGPADGAGL